MSNATSSGTQAKQAIEWRRLHWSGPGSIERATASLRALATNQRSPHVVFESRASGGQVRYLMGTRPQAIGSVLSVLCGLMPELHATKDGVEREPVTAAGRVSASTRHRALRSEPSALQSSIRTVLAALTRASREEELVLQIVLGPPRVPLAIPTKSPSSIVSPWYTVAWNGNGQQVDPDKRAGLREKVGDHGFALSLRLGVRAASPQRRAALLLGVLGSIRTGESGGLQLRLLRERPARVNSTGVPWRWPLRLNVRELTGLTAWPLDADDLPGQPPAHPKLVAPKELARKGDRIIADANAPGVAGQIGYNVTDACRHTWVIGPNGTGKSTLLLRLITQDLEAGRPVIVIEPKELVADVLARIPKHRVDDVVVLDPTSSVPVGINPLQRHGRRPELVADTLLSMFQALYTESGLGPRSTDILSNALHVLARHDGASLAMLPLLLTNAPFRRKLTRQIVEDDPIAAGPFWGWFESLTDESRSQVIAPLSNKLRPLIRPQLRAILGQPRPRFNIRQVLEQKKVLLVPLQPGVLGPDAAELVAAVVMSELWIALRERAAIPEADREPVMIFADEVQQYLRLPTDLADALATSRSLRGAWHLAHQYREQLSPAMRAAFEANARSRIAFTLNAADARALAAGQQVLSPEDFSQLPGYHVYAQLVRGNTLQPWASGVTMPPPTATSAPAEVRARSQANYGVPVADIEAEFASLLYRRDAVTKQGQTGRRPRRSGPTRDEAGSPDAGGAV